MKSTLDIKTDEDGFSLSLGNGDDKTRPDKTKEARRNGFEKRDLGLLAGGVGTAFGLTLLGHASSNTNKKDAQVQSAVGIVVVVISTVAVAVSGVWDRLTAPKSLEV